MNPIEPFLEKFGVLILDGGLATELERCGYDLDDSLWSARLLIEAPEAIETVHRSYLEAGADCIVSASYQATIEGFTRRGASETEAVRLLRLSVEIAARARDRFWAKEESRSAGRLRPLVAASIGPYGAFLADGGEYRGDYGIGEEELVKFHRPRWQVLADTAADVVACETIPSIVEACALVRLLSETPQVWAWVSFSCRNGREVSDGTPVAEAARVVSTHSQVLAVGVNCTSPAFILEIVETVRSVTAKPIVVYPNGGETYDAATRSWRGSSDPDSLSRLSPSWRRAGARLIGGCCRTEPHHIALIRALQVTPVSDRGQSAP